MNQKSLTLAVDMYGCPNRCGHCWLGHMPNKQMDSDSDVWIVNYFKPFFNKITYYSWLREPDFCSDYKERWKRDMQLSVNSTPQRFELASFWRIVRDPEYVKFLKDVGTKKVQLTFFGMEELTDKYVGRKGAFQELLKATEILIDNHITPRWQAFINEENKNSLVELLQLTETLKLRERCISLQDEFKFFIHAGSCDGENRKLYDIRIQRSDIPEVLKKYYLDFEKVLTERECVERLENDTSYPSYHNDDLIVLYISNIYNVYFNFTNMSEAWKIGNLKEESSEELVRSVLEEDTYALNLAKAISFKELAGRYGDRRSQRVFFLDDYKDYLMNCFLDDKFR